TWTRRSLSGHRDPLSVTWLGGAGSRSASISYAMPVGPTGARMGLGVSYTQIDVIEGDFGDVGLRGDTANFDLSAQGPFRLGDRPASWSVAYNVSDSGTYLE